MDLQHQEVDDWENVNEINLSNELNKLLVSKPVSQPRPEAHQSGSSASYMMTSNIPELTISFVTPTAAALGVKEGPIDPILISCLENPREKMNLLMFEDEIVAFLKNPTQDRLVFPPLSSYHRLIVYRLAQRCQLDHTSSTNAEPVLPDGSGNRSIAIFKTPETFMPSLLLINLSKEKKEASPAPRIMIRRKKDNKNSNDEKNAFGKLVNMGNRKKSLNDSSNAPTTIEDREKAYAEARARIFGTSGIEDKAITEPSTTQQPLQHGIHAAGPDGTIGFGRGRGKSSVSINERPSPPVQHIAKPSTNKEKKLESTSYVSRKKNPQCVKDWRESKATLRNREEEMNDPDFTRNYNVYKPNFAPYRILDNGPSPHSNYNDGGYYTNPPPPPHMLAPMIMYNPSARYPNEYSAQPPPPLPNHPAYLPNDRFPSPSQPPLPRYPPSSNEPSFDGDNRSRWESNSKASPSLNMTENISYREEFPPLG